jgi:hypothetical protein
MVAYRLTTAKSAKLPGHRVRTIYCRSARSSASAAKMHDAVTGRDNLENIR